MRKELELKLQVGKTFEGFAFSGYGQAVLVFSDGTFSTLRATEDREIEEDQLDLYNFGGEALIATGIVTEDELERLRAEQVAKLKAERAANQEEHDRREYERLRRKYESGAE